jgi:hypothetical protein
MRLWFSLFLVLPLYANDGKVVVDQRAIPGNPDFGRDGAMANPAAGVSHAPVLSRLLIGYDRYYPQ